MRLNNSINKLTISNMLILISAVFTVFATINSNYYRYGMNDMFLRAGEYHIYAMQFFSSQFLHWGLLHLTMNALFIYIFWNAVEHITGIKKYILFFVFSAWIIGLSITLLWSWNTIGMSGFAMSVVAYYTLQLKSVNHPDYKWWITAIVVNIAIGLTPGISLLGHLFWAIAWVVYYYLLKIWNKLS